MSLSKKTNFWCDAYVSYILLLLHNVYMYKNMLYMIFLIWINKKYLYHYLNGESAWEAQGNNQDNIEHFNIYLNISILTLFTAAPLWISNKNIQFGVLSFLPAQLFFPQNTNYTNQYNSICSLLSINAKFRPGYPEGVNRISYW